MTVLLAGYFVLRFGVLSVGTPGLIERSSGYLFEILDPPELRGEFGDRLAVVLRLQRRLVGALGAGVRAAERSLRHAEGLAGRTDDVRALADVRQLARDHGADRWRRRAGASTVSLRRTRAIA